MLNSLKLWFFSIIFILKKVPFLIKTRKFDDKKREELIFQQIKNFSTYVLHKMKFELEIEYEDKQEYLNLNNIMYVSNHSSILDPFFTLQISQKNTSYFIANEYEFVRKIPILKTYFNIMNNIWIDRNSLKNGIRAIKKSTEILKNGNNIFVFPEGEITHLITDNIIGEFKGGAFKSALKAKIGILPITIIGTDKIQKDVSIFGKITQAKVKIYIHKYIRYEEIQNLSTDEIAKLLSKIIESKIKI